MNLGHFIPLDLYFAFFIVFRIFPLRLPLPSPALSASYGGVMDCGAGSKAGTELSGTISLETFYYFYSVHSGTFN